MTISHRRSDQVLFASRLLRGLVDQARGAVEHSHGPDHVNVAGSRREPAIASGQRRTGPRQCIFREEFAGEREAEENKHVAGAYHAKQRMYEKKDYEKERRPERVKQHRASAGFDKLTQNGKIPIDVRCACRIAAEGVFAAKPTARSGRSRSSNHAASRPNTARRKASSTPPTTTVSATISVSISSVSLLRLDKTRS